MIILFLFSTWGGAPTKVDTYPTMETCLAAAAAIQPRDSQTWFYRTLCVPDASAMEEK